MTKYLAYVRNRRGSAPSIQLLQIERYAKRNHLDISQWFLEGDRSAAKPRPVFRRMLKDLKAGKASGVISNTRERFTRNLAEWSEILELRERGADFRFAGESMSRGAPPIADFKIDILSPPE